MGDDSFDFNQIQSKKAKNKQWNELREKIKNDDYGNDSKIDRLGYGYNKMELNLNKEGTIKLDEKINKIIYDEFDKLASSDFLNELKELEKRKNKSLDGMHIDTDLPDVSNAVLTHMSLDEFEIK